MRQYSKVTRDLHNLYVIVIFCQFKRSLSQYVTFITIQAPLNEILITIKSRFISLFNLSNKKLTSYLKISLTFSFIAYKIYSKCISN